MNDKKNIVWADDEIDLLKPHILLLEERGYNIIPVNSGEDAIDECSKAIIDLVLVDEMMTGLDGLSTITIIKNKWPDIPVIMITKNEEEWLMEEAIGSQIANYLTKPVNPSQVLMACKNILEVKKIQDNKLINDFFKYVRDISIDDFADNDINQWYQKYNALCDWSINLSSVKDKNIINMLYEQKKTIDLKFNDFILDNYKQWICQNTVKNIAKPILSNEIFDTTLKPILNNNRKLIFIIVDCLRLDQWKTISELLYPSYNIKENFHISIIPTATPFARNAIFSGLLPNDLKEEYPDLWKKMFYENQLNAFEDILFKKMLEKNGFGDLSNKYLKISDLSQGNKFINKINDYKNINILSLVVNFVDILGHSRSESKVLSELIPNEAAYRTAILNWFNNSWLLEALSIMKDWNDVDIVITSDHGNTQINTPVTVKGDQSTSMGIRYKYGRNLRVDNKHVFKISNPKNYNLPMFDINTEYIIAKDSGYFVYRNDYHKYVNMYKNTFQHGGISMDEMIVPLIHLKSK